MVRYTLFVWIAIFFFTGAGSAQDGVKSYDLPVDKLECLSENRKKYLDLPRALIIFSPTYCPYVGREEAAYLAQNSAEDTEKVDRLFLRKTDFSCLVEKIDEYMQSETAMTIDAPRTVTLQLDCD